MEYNFKDLIIAISKKLIVDIDNKDKIYLIKKITKLILKYKFKYGIDYKIDNNKIFLSNTTFFIIGDFINSENEFNLYKYLFIIYVRLNNLIKDGKKEHKYTSDLLLDDLIDERISEIILRTKRLQMITGKIWQIALGTYKGFIDLEVGHSSGLDIINEQKKMIFEIKNRTNTDNDSSKTNNFRKLSRYKSDNVDYKCYYGCINDDTIEKTKSGKEKKIIFESNEIIYISGYKLLNLILDKDTNLVVQFIRIILSFVINYTNYNNI